MSAGVSAEEVDLLQRSKKKTKRGLFERDNDPMDMEEEDPANSMPEQVDQNNKYVKGPAISFKRALTGMRHKEGDPRGNNGRNMGGKNKSLKGESRGNQGSSTNKFNKEGFTIWNNSRYGALENLEEDTEEEAQEEYTMMERPDGPTERMLRRENVKGRQTVHKTKERSKSTKRNKKQTNQAAETDSHTVVRGYDKGTRVEKTTIDEEGSKTEIFHDRTETGDHH
nr:uncharacterized protein LOC109158743 [Ipomoea batatas]